MKKETMLLSPLTPEEQGLLAAESPVQIEHKSGSLPRPKLNKAKPPRTPAPDEPPLISKPATRQAGMERAQSRGPSYRPTWNPGPKSRQSPAQSKARRSAA